MTLPTSGQRLVSFPAPPVPLLTSGPATSPAENIIEYQLTNRLAGFSLPILCVTGPPPHPPHVLPATTCCVHPGTVGSDSTTLRLPVCIVSGIWQSSWKSAPILGEIPAASPSPTIGDPACRDMTRPCSCFTSSLELCRGTLFRIGKY